MKLPTSTSLAQILTIIFLLVSTAYSIDVPTNSAVYDFLDRCEVKGLLKKPLPSSKPYSRAQIAEFLFQIGPKTESLTSIERRQLEYFRFMFSDELARMGVNRDSIQYRPAWSGFASQGLFRKLRLFTNQRDAFSYVEDDKSIYINPVVRQSFHLKRSKNWNKNPAVTESTSGFELWGNYGDFSFHSIGTDTRVRGDTKYWENTTYTRVIGKPGGFDYDDSEASIQYRHSGVSVLFGKVKNLWGPGYSGSLCLSDQPTAYTQFRFKFNLGPFQFTSLQGKLLQEPKIVTNIDSTIYGEARREYADKFMAAHRLEFTPNRFLQLGFYEVIIYGERGMDIDYLNPLIFLRPVEHYGRDRDNAFLGIDAKLLLPFRSKAYGELLIDDLKTSKLGTGNIHNKLGYLAGIKTVDLMGLTDWNLQAEYIRLSPYLYTHKFPVNVAQQNGYNLGYPVPPNSEVIFIQVEKQLRRELKAALSFRNHRHGGNVMSEQRVLVRNVGGDILVPYRKGIDDEYNEFLDGDLELEREITLEFDAELAYNIYLVTYVSSIYRKLEPDKSQKSWAFGITLSWILR